MFNVRNAESISVLQWLQYLTLRLLAAYNYLVLCCFTFCQYGEPCVELVFCIELT
jgi:hypothetical protein